MFFANDIHGIRTYIDDAVKNQTYFCPACGDSMIIKRGKIVAPHFSHKGKTNCDSWFTHKMSIWHKMMQSKFPSHSREVIVWNSEHTEFHIADILLKHKDKTYIFEFQHSTISYSEFSKRSSFYLSLGYILIWIFDFCDAKKIFYDTLDVDPNEIHLIWPGRDRIRFLDNFYKSDLTYPYPESNLHILFHICTGHGSQILHEAGDLSWYTWEFDNPFFLEKYFVEPQNLYDYYENFSSFYATYYTEEEFYDILNSYSEQAAL